MNREELMTSVIQLLEESELSNEDKDLWRVRLEASEDAKVQMFLSAAKDPQILKLATVSLKKKLPAEGDPDKLREIMLQEARDI